MPSIPAINTESGRVRLRLLFFEDDIGDIELSLRALKAANYDVNADTAATPEEFRERIQSDTYDVILSDYRMPGATGMDAFEIMKQASVKTPFILLTGSLGDERAVECLKEGVADYVLKDRLIRLPIAIRRALEEQRLRRESEAAADALRRSEASYRSLIQHAPCAILRVDAVDGSLLEVNPAFAEMLGYSSTADLLADRETARAALGPPLVIHLLKRCGPDGLARDAEIVWNRKAGAPLVVRLVGRLLRNNEGCPVCFEMTAENITERRNAEERIRQLNRLYSVLSRVGQAVVRFRRRDDLFNEVCRVLVEVGHIPTASVAMMDTGKLLPVTSAGLPCECLDNLLEKIPGDPGSANPASEAIREGRKVVSNGAGTASAGASRANARGRCDSFGAFPISLYGAPVGAVVIATAQPDFFDAENTALFDELAANISFALESMEAERMRQRAIEELDQFFSLGLDMVCIFDINGRMLRLNPAWQRTLGFTDEEMCSRLLADLVYPDDQQHALATLARLRKGTAVTNFEIRFRVKGGGFRWLMAAATPDLQRNVVFAVAADITERKHLEDRLRKQNLELEDQNRRIEAASRMKSEFLANMSHELRSPLNGIIGFTELLYDGKVGAIEARPRELLGRIHKSSKHLLELINGILDLSKVEAGRLELRAERVRLPGIVQEIVDILGAQAAAKKIPIAVTIDPVVETVSTDVERFRQILHNYLSNALKFTPDRGRVAVRISPENAWEFRLEVEDSGIGIAERDKPLLFSEFQQLDSTSGKRYQGTGLGLALTKRIVEAQRGRVGVHSVLGQGSTFFAVLPRDAQALPSRPAVLVIEDDSIQSYVLTRILEAAGYAVETARTCFEALAKCRKRRFDAITLDLVLPDRPGPEALAEVRATEEHRNTPVIIISSLDEEAAHSIEAQGFLAKPVEGKDLIAMLERCGVGVQATEPELEPLQSV